MTIIRANSKEVYRIGKDDDCWYFSRTAAGVNIAWSSPPQSGAVCIPASTWEEIMAVLTKPEAEVAPPPKKRRRKRAPKIPLE